MRAVCLCLQSTRYWPGQREFWEGGGEVEIAQGYEVARRMAGFLGEDTTSGLCVTRL